jgi:hypothetical protein
LGFSRFLFVSLGLVLLKSVISPQQSSQMTMNRRLTVFYELHTKGPCGRKSISATRSLRPRLILSRSQASG